METAETIKKVGRPPKLTPEVQGRITNAIAAGSYIETAAAYAGISKETLYDWLKTGAKAKTGKHKEFSDAVKKALAAGELRDLAVIDKAASGYEVVKTRIEDGVKGRTETTETHWEFAWQAAAWKLERKFPSRWGRRDHVDLGDGADRPVQIEAVIDLYTDPRKMAELIAAFIDVQIIPAEFVRLIDSGDGANENGQDPNR